MCTHLSLGTQTLQIPFSFFLLSFWFTTFSHVLSIAFFFVSREPRDGTKRKIETFSCSFSCAPQKMSVLGEILLCSGALEWKALSSHSTAKLSLDFNVLFVFRQHPSLKGWDLPFLLSSSTTMRAQDVKKFYAPAFLVSFLLSAHVESLMKNHLFPRRNCFRCDGSFFRVFAYTGTKPACLTFRPHFSDDR